MAKKGKIFADIPLIETFVHQYNGVIQPVDIAVTIDYKFGRIALVEHDKYSKNHPVVAPKAWVFANRELEYMQEWQDILDGMKSAIAVATKKLELYQKDHLTI